MDRREQVDIVTGKTFTTSSSVGSYSQSQIIPYTQPGRTFTTSGSVGSYSQSQIIPYSQTQITPYTQPRLEYGNSSNQTKVTKSKSASSWNLDDPELKRRRRVASYKVYTVEGRMKSSLRKSVRWFKNKYLEMRYGWW